MSGGQVDISGGMVISNNAGGDLESGFDGTIHINNWDGPSSLPDFANGNSVACWAGSNIYFEPGSVTQDLSTDYGASSCIHSNDW